MSASINGDHTSNADPESKVCLLLVEDNDIDARVVERLIRKIDWDVELIHACNGEEALKLLLADQDRSQPLPSPMVALVDIKMPRMDGLELLDALDQRQCASPFGPLFMLSTSMNPSDRMSAMRHERVAGYLLKPLSAQVLEDVLSAALDFAER